MRAVVDASIFGRVLLRQASPDEAARIKAFLAAAELVQPAHWPLELAGLAVRGAREKRLPPEMRKRMRDQLRALVASAEVDGPLPAHTIFDRAVEYSLSVYDAAYLELAMREEIALVTEDGPLKAAARKAKLEIVDLS